MTSLQLIGTGQPLIDLVLALAVSATMYISLTRFGFITYLTAMYVYTLILLMPVTIDFTTWYAGASAMVVLIVLALAGYGMHAGLAGRGIIEDELL